MTDFEQRYVTARKAVIARDLARLNPMQRQGAMTTEGPLLLLAGRRQRQDHRAHPAGLQPADLWPGQRQRRGAGLGHGGGSATFWSTSRIGQTVTEVRRAHRLCAVDAPRPWEIIAITFTNKAAGS
ncbi:MAG: hypothetical protein ACLSHO_13525 [Dysosmobacter sp.]